MPTAIEPSSTTTPAPPSIQLQENLANMRVKRQQVLIRFPLQSRSAQNGCARLKFAGGSVTSSTL